MMDQLLEQILRNGIASDSVAGERDRMMWKIAFFDLNRKYEQNNNRLARC